MRQTIALFLIFLSVAIVGCCNMHADSPHKRHGFRYPTVAEIGAADKDILGEAALRQPGGASYEFLRDALPPLRYVDANFHVYPITLSAPANPTKARFVSNGSAINALARQPDWGKEMGTPVTFYVGEQRELFGSDLARLNGPRYADGYLPIVQTEYRSQGSTFGEEAFCSTDAKLADDAVVFVKFTLLQSDGRTYGGIDKLPAEPAARVPVPGVESAANTALWEKVYNAKIEASIEGYIVSHLENGRLINLEGKIVAAVYPQWAFNPGRGALIAPLKVGESAYVAICTKPADPSVLAPLTSETYQQERTACAKTWNEFLNSGMVIKTPEPVVNNAWRSLLIGDQELRSGEQIHYSAGNQYDKIYIGEGGDTVKATALWGHGDDARHEIIPQFRYTRKGLEFHQAAFKLQMLAAYYHLTGDAKFVRSIQPLWEKELNVILNGRQKSTGMLPREKYCGDIATMVYSLNSNSNCWRALRDMSIMLDDLGEHDRAQELSQTAAEYRKVILAAIEKATRHDVNPPFVPIALSGEESPHDPIWATTIGSYWNLMIEYVLGSGVFTPDSQTATDIVKYLQQKGGLTMGLLRARADELNFYMDGSRINDLYGMRYALLLDQRDDPERALVSFYGKLSQGMTRDTFIGCEGSSLVPVDRFGRQMYLPPNSAGNANFLQQLRYLLIQDYDTNDDGRADTLRLLFATPRAWMGDGKSIEMRNAPTVFGTLSMNVHSHLFNGTINAHLDLPEHAPQQIYLRLRLPEGHKVISASAGGRTLKIDGETIDLAGMKGNVNVDAKVK